MQYSGTPKTLPLLIVAAVVVLALSCVFMVATAAAFAGNWGWSGWWMGSGHMRQMMSGGTNTSSAPASVGGKTESVGMRNSSFSPGNLEVPVGATVRWSNFDAVPHTATARDGSWDTGMFNSGESRSITFAKAGVYEYYCKVHPSMIAKVTVH